MAAWSNWSGSLKFSPGEIREPSSEEELSRIVTNAALNLNKIRVAGAGHSSSPLVVTPGILVSLKKFRSVERIDKKSGTAWVGTGMTVKEAGEKLLEHGLSFHNTGDVDIQYLAGAISTGTHGTGIRLQNLSSMLTGCRIVLADGSVKEFTEEKHGSPIFNALRVSMGILGIMTSMRLQLLPLFTLERSEWCTHTDKCLLNLDGLIGENRNFDFYWYPRNDMVKLRILNEPGKGTQSLSYARPVLHGSGYAIEILPRERDLKFDEMEYSLPFEAGLECFSEIRKIIKSRFRKTVAWRVLYRTIAADENYLSPHTGRNSVTISLHQNAGLPFMDYFRTIEPVFRHFGGRPHWGKKHTLKATELKQSYPEWNKFMQIRKEIDPGGLFMNEYLKQIFDEDDKPG
jgi:FAD/FMN-containing dehydrogenase